MPAAEIYGALSLANDHWRTGKVSAVVRKDQRKRRSFFKWKEKFPQLPFHIIIGPRQVGKTTTMGHLMQDLIEKGVPAQRIIYVGIDQPAMLAELDNGFEPLLEAMERFLLGGPLAEQKEPAYLFLDEIQALDDWPKHLKSLYDRFHPWLRVVATGSSAAALRNAPRHEGVGRWTVDQLFPLKFNEIMDAVQPQVFDSDSESLAWKTAHDARKLLQAYGGGKQRLALLKSLDTVYAALLPHSKQLKSTWDRFLVQGGYPAAILAKKPEDAFLFLLSAVEAAVTTDLKLFRGLRKPNQFRAFLANLGRNHAGKFNGASYAQEMGLQKETPARWKAVTEELYLVRQLGAVTYKGKRQPRRPDKAYIQDSGIRAYLASENDLAALEAKGTVGHLVEGIIHDHLLRLQFMSMNGPGDWPVGYADPPEIDFLAVMQNCWLAVESRYSPKISNHDLEEFRRRLAKLQLDKPLLSVILSRDTYEVKGDIIVMPAWMFCYLV